jgi:hypothetical protein
MAKLLYVQFSHKLNKYSQSGKMQTKNMKLMKNPIICIMSNDILNFPTICKQSLHLGSFNVSKFEPKKILVQAL